MSGKVMTLGVAGAEVQLIASDENFAADLANADRPRPARAHSRQRWPSEPLASLHWPSRESLRSRRLRASRSSCVPRLGSMFGSSSSVAVSDTAISSIAARGRHTPSTPGARRNRIARHGVGSLLVSPERRKKRMSGTKRLPGGERRKASQRNKPARPAPSQVQIAWRAGDPVKWKDRTGLFRREVGDNEHAEIAIAERVYRVKLSELG